MDRNELIDQVLLQMDRVWGDKGLDGGSEEYEWLQHYYDINEGEDVQWFDILGYKIGNLMEEDLDDDEKMQFLGDDHAVCTFLTELLRKYQSNTIEYQHI